MKTSLILTTASGRSPFVGNISGVLGRLQLKKFEELLRSVKGQGRADRLVARPVIKAATQTASARLTLASVQAADTVTLNGTALTAANGSPGANEFDSSLASDTLVATDFVRALLASATALISSHLGASNKSAIVTCASVAALDTVSIAGVVLTAKTGTAAVNTGLTINEFSRTGTDTQAGTALTSAINSHPTLSQIVFAVNASGAVSLYERPPTTGQTIPVSTSNGTRLAITGSLTALTAGAIVHIESLIPGIAGNAATIASSNGTRLAIEGSASRLSGGTQSTFTY